MSSSIFLPFLITLIFILSSFSNAIVPPSRTFKYVNQGKFGNYVVEYLANHRELNVSTFPFTLCFYNSTPNAFILGLRMGHQRSRSIMRWVWDANRAKPVREMATLAFGKDGNLVLAEADGTIAWQTNTPNKGVVGLNLLQNGNLVLYDAKGKYVWQSFDHPTDTLLVGQSLKAVGGPTRLVSRTSITEPVNGPYSFVMEQRHWAMYYQTNNTPKPLLYYKSADYGNGKGALAYLDFYCESPIFPIDNYPFELGFRFNFSNSESYGIATFSLNKYNSTYTMFRVDLDGNLKMYTYDETVASGAWEVTYMLFDRTSIFASECKLPKRCGSLGVCDDNQCVGCPSTRGLLGWSSSCAPPILPPCKGGTNVDYFKVEGVEHFTGEYDEGSRPMSPAQCKDECSKDCKCLGVFYRVKSSKCLLVHELGTLIKVSNPSHVGYIKISK